MFFFRQFMPDRFKLPQGTHLPPPNTTHQFGEFEIQPDFNTITRDGLTSQLSPRVMDVLMHLIKNSDRIVPANELLETFWTDRVVEESTIHRHISQIRAALGDSAKEASYIKTVSKRGYQAVAAIKVISAPVPAEAKVHPVPDEPAQSSAQADSGSETPYVFISYSHKDSNVVYKEIKWLENQGIKIWYDKGITPGSNWLTAIGDSLLGSSTVLFFVSAQSLASEHCNREVSLALDEGINIIPIYLDNTELTSDLKVGLSRVQALRLKEQGFRTQLLQTLSFANTDKVQISAVTPTKTKSSRMTIAVAFALVVTITGFLSFLLMTGQPENTLELDANGEPVESIAVLPFTNLSERESVGFFAKGLSDSILDELAQLGHVRVASRTSTFQLAKEEVELTDIAKRLNVGYILEGSVQEQDGQLRITTQLIRASDGFHVLSKTYQHQFKDSFTAQRQISRNISHMSHDKIALDLKRLYPESYEEFRGIKPEAVSLYLESTERYVLYVLGEGGDLTVMMQLMEKAVEIDPTFQLAHAELAMNYIQRFNTKLSLAESVEYAKVAINRIQALNPDSSEIPFYLTLLSIQLELDYATAEKLLKQVIESAPAEFYFRSMLATIAVREGRIKEALELGRSDITLLPDSQEADVFPFVAEFFMLTENYSEALKYSDSALDLIQQGPPRAKVLLTKVDTLLSLDRLEEAKPLVEEAWYAAEGKFPERFAQIFTRIGQPERARKALESAVVNYDNRRFFALGYESLGEIDTVFELIHDGIQDHDPSILFVMRLNFWSDQVLQDPRFLEMLDLLESKEKHTPQYLRDHDGRSVKAL
ncbi:MAG: TolB-like protein/DNA-binding winged helix-turn-helix (wHTH) protein [Candidatus Azotimanducaceae bacterium]|jgi:TolB-like protein/DNA-binding winged helix-turn-helix (wHTH) protein